MKIYLVILFFVFGFISCDESSNQEKSTIVKSVYENEYVSVAVMEKLDDFMAGYNSLVSKTEEAEFYNMLFFSNDAGCYVSFMECPKSYNHKEIIGHFEYRGKEVIVYFDDSRCAMGFVNVENLSNTPIIGLTDITDTNNLSAHSVYSSTFIIYELYTPNELIYVSF